MSEQSIVYVSDDFSAFFTAGDEIQLGTAGTAIYGVNAFSSVADVLEQKDDGTLVAFVHSYSRRSAGKARVYDGMHDYGVVRNGELREISRGTFVYLTTADVSTFNSEQDGNLYLDGEDIAITGGTVRSIFMGDSRMAHGDGGTVTVSGGTVKTVRGATTDGVSYSGTLELDGVDIQSVSVVNVPHVILTSGTHTLGDCETLTTCYTDTISVQEDATLNWTLADGQDTLHYIGTVPVDAYGRIHVDGTGNVQFTQTGVYSMDQFDVTAFAGTMSVADNAVLCADDAAEYIGDATVQLAAGSELILAAETGSTGMALTGEGALSITGEQTLTGDCGAYTGVASVADGAVLRMENDFGGVVDLGVAESDEGATLILNSDGMDMPHSVIGNSLDTIRLDDNASITHADAFENFTGTLDIGESTLVVAAEMTLLNPLVGTEDSEIDVEENTAFYGDYSAYNGRFVIDEDAVARFNTTESEYAIRVEGAGTVLFENAGEAVTISVTTDDETETNIDFGGNDGVLVDGSFGNITGDGGVSVSGEVSVQTLDYRTITIDSGSTLVSDVFEIDDLIINFTDAAFRGPFVVTTVDTKVERFRVNFSALPMAGQYILVDMPNMDGMGNDDAEIYVTYDGAEYQLSVADRFQLGQTNVYVYFERDAAYDWTLNCFDMNPSVVFLSQTMDDIGTITVDGKDYQLIPGVNYFCNEDNAELNAYELARDGRIEFICVDRGYFTYPVLWSNTSNNTPIDTLVIRSLDNTEGSSIRSLASPDNNNEYVRGLPELHVTLQNCYVYGQYYNYCGEKDCDFTSELILDNASSVRTSYSIYAGVGQANTGATVSRDVTSSLTVYGGNYSGVYLCSGGYINMGSVTSDCSMLIQNTKADRLYISSDILGNAHVLSFLEDTDFSKVKFNSTITIDTSNADAGNTVIGANIYAGGYIAQRPAEDPLISITSEIIFTGDGSKLSFNGTVAGDCERSSNLNTELDTTIHFKDYTGNFDGLFYNVETLKISGDSNVVMNRKDNMSIVKNMTVVFDISERTQAETAMLDGKSSSVYKCATSNIVIHVGEAASGHYILAQGRRDSSFGRNPAVQTINDYTDDAGNKYVINFAPATDTLSLDYTRFADRTDIELPSGSASSPLSLDAFNTTGVDTSSLNDDLAAYSSTTELLNQTNSTVQNSLLAAV